MAVPYGDELLAGSSDTGAGAVEGGRGGGRGKRKSEGGGRRRRNMLFVSGMMGVKRNCLGTLRYGCVLRRPLLVLCTVRVV